MLLLLNERDNGSLESVSYSLIADNYDLVTNEGSLFLHYSLKDITIPIELQPFELKNQPKNFLLSTPIKEIVDYLSS